ncbi:hypothetical protein HYC85_029383 [Camellia sinensis]|uniref:Reverse transcriptase zinc-binding domain-containing protein n=1 Tax=Camellia sinensis TaxID=4442 RepID=A0A7J7FXW9_CAMSI|nr:hypothetical protein HYC85_029383 [Camellia sinensis]
MMKDRSEESGACVSDSTGWGTSSEYGDDVVKRWVDGIVYYTPGFIRSLSGSEGNKAGIQIEVDLNRAQPTGGHGGPAQRDVGLSQIGCSTSQPHIEFTGHIQSPNLRQTLVGVIEGESRNSRNSLSSIIANGSMIEEPLELKAAVKAHFMRQFSESWKVRPKLSGPFKSIGGALAVDQLEAEFTEEEVRTVISEFFARRVDDDGWNLSFRRFLLVWEEEEAKRLFNLLNNAPPLCPNRSDELKWRADPTELFSVASAYKWCESHMGPVVPVADLIWNNFAPPRVQFFGWLAWLVKRSAQVLMLSALVPSLLMSEAELAQNADVCLFMLCNAVSSGCANSGCCLVCGLDSVTLPSIMYSNDATFRWYRR